MYKIIGLGAGGHAKVLIEIIGLLENFEIVGLLDPDPEKKDKFILGIPIFGDDSLLLDLVAQGVQYAFIGLGGTKNTKPRETLYQKALVHGFKMLSILHPTAIISPSASIGTGANILPGVIINADARLGQNVIVNSGAIIEHDCVIGDHVHIASGARLASTVHVEKGSHIGLGAVVRQCIRIGNNSVVGAGAVVVKDVAPNSVVVGVPAKEIQGMI